MSYRGTTIVVFGSEREFSCGWLYSLSAAKVLMMHNDVNIMNININDNDVMLIMHIVNMGHDNTQFILGVLKPISCIENHGTMYFQRMAYQDFAMMDKSTRETRRLLSRHRKHVSASRRATLPRDHVLHLAVPRRSRKWIKFCQIGSAGHQWCPKIVRCQ